MNELNDLQKALEPRYRTRDFGIVVKIFERGGHNLQAEIYDRLFVLDNSRHRDFCILDVGCASGDAIEQITRSLTRAMNYMQRGIKICGIGVDLNIPSDISSHIISDDSELSLGSKLLSELHVGDATNLPVESDSVDVLYSSNTLFYVADVLRAFEEGYRVLRSGGIAYFDISLRDISICPNFLQILQQTPGATDVFEYVSIDDKSGFVVLRKGAEDFFRGFPFKLFREVLFQELEGAYVPDVSDIATHYRNAVYTVISN